MWESVAGAMRNSLDLIKIGCECLNDLTKDGCEVEIISDSVQAEEMMRLMGKTNLTVKLSGQFNDFTSAPRPRFFGRMA